MIGQKKTRKKVRGILWPNFIGCHTKDLVLPLTSVWQPLCGSHRPMKKLRRETSQIENQQRIIFYFSDRSKMPMKRKYKKTARALVPYKNRFPGRAYAMGSPSVGLGHSAKTVIRTSFFANCVAAASGIFTGYLNPGSAFDPTGDQSTIQGNTYDQFAAIYSRYKVDRCVIHLNICGSNAAGALMFVAAAFPGVDSTALANYQAYASQPGAKSVSNTFPVLANTIGSSGQPVMLKFDLNHNKVLGTTVDAYDSGALTNASPTNGQFMVLPFIMQGNAAGAHTFVVEVDMWQYVTFCQRKNVVDA